jgi:NADPH-dependent 2,4-dienoyl-CoA reductase/sulfur reductase-like enzyme
VGESDVLLDDGTTLPAEVVLLATGVKPDLAIADAAGVEMDAGVLVNQYLETSVPRIYAAGDIARYPEARSGLRIRSEHWAVAQRQGQIAACNMLGLQVPFTAVPFFRTEHYETEVACVGHAPDFTHITVEGAPETGNCAASFMAGRELLAYVSIGRDRQSLKAERELERRASGCVAVRPLIRS